MIKRVLSICLALFLLIGTSYINKDSSSIGEAQEKASLDERLEHLIEKEAILNNGLIGISIRSASTGEVLYERNGDLRLTPASNMKLLTATTALKNLGENYRFTTRILTDGRIIKGKLDGNLYLEGRGDPTLTKQEFLQFARKLSKQGIKHIKGNIVADDTWFDGVAYSPDVIWSDEQAYYGASISSLTAAPDSDFDAGTVIIRVEPSNRVGQKPIISTQPAIDYVNIINQAITVEADREKELTIRRIHGENTITIQGSIPLNSAPEKEWIAVWNPTSYAVTLFEQALREEGITWSGDISQGVTPPNASILHIQKSIPLSKIMVPFLKLSNNTIGEVLVKEMGKQSKGVGSWDAGIAVMKKELRDYGLKTEELNIRDGSGLSQINLLTANELSDLLYQVQERTWFKSFVNALPTAGATGRMDGGTLRYRMKNLPKEVVAKTGTLSTVSSLSGYIGLDGKKNHAIIFSVLINNIKDEDEAKKVEDKIVTFLANSLF